MHPWHFTLERWPERTFSIHRRLRDDPRFREIVGDYEIARAAQQHWRAADPPGTRRITDYERIVRELEEEIEQNLSSLVPPTRSDAQIGRSHEIRAPAKPADLNPKEPTR